MDKLGTLGATPYSAANNKTNLANPEQLKQQEALKNAQQSKSASKSGSSSSSSSKSAGSPSLPKPKTPDADYNVSLSDKSKALAEDITKEVVKNEALDQVKEAVSDKADKIEKIQPSKGTLKKPAIFFLGGMEIFGLSSEKYGGVKKMAEAVEGSRFYGWNQQKEIINEIEKRDKSQPVILVGHSFGGDSAVEIANELNSLEKGFRKVDLLVTIDSIGVNNDIIPQNVKKNLNYISESWLSDGPNIARDAKKTQIENYLRNDSHTELDDAVEVQSQILEEIANLV
jgi:hypothetical protein